MHIDTEKATPFANSTERPIAIVWMTVAEAKELVAELQVVIAKYDAKPSCPPRPQPKHDSGVWEHRRTDRKWWRRLYESGRS